MSTKENRKRNFSSVQFLSSVQLFATPWTATRQASLSITSSQSSPKPMAIESVMPSNHLILCRPLLLPPWIFPSIRVFSNESVLHIRWPKYRSFSNMLLYNKTMSVDFNTKFTKRPQLNKPLENQILGVSFIQRMTLCLIPESAVHLWWVPTETHACHFDTLYCEWWYTDAHEA